MYTTEEAAKMLGVTPRTVWNCVHDGRIRAEKIQGRWMFTEEAITEYLQGRKEKRKKQQRSRRREAENEGRSNYLFENAEMLF